MGASLALSRVLTCAWTLPAPAAILPASGVVTRLCPRAPFSLDPACARAFSLTLTCAALSLMPPPSRRRAATSAAPVLAHFLLLSRVRLRSLSFSRAFFVLSPPSYQDRRHFQAPLPSHFLSCARATKTSNTRIHITTYSEHCSLHWERVGYFATETEIIFPLCQSVCIELR